jgi:hypothetical protein
MPTAAAIRRRDPRARIQIRLQCWDEVEFEASASRGAVDAAIFRAVRVGLGACSSISNLSDTGSTSALALCKTLDGCSAVLSQAVKLSR